MLHDPRRDVYPRLEILLCEHKDLHEYAHCSNVWNSENMDTTQMSVSKWMG